jgi:hypothetical protein
MAAGVESGKGGAGKDGTGALIYSPIWRVSGLSLFFAYQKLGEDATVASGPKLLGDWRRETKLDKGAGRCS